MKIQTVILAAGKGTRMQSDVPKPLIEVNGEPMLTHVLKAVEESAVETAPIIVVGSWTTAIQDYYGNKYQYAVQEEINGTGGAVLSALPLLNTSEAAPPVLILYADHPFITSPSINKLAKLTISSPSVLSMYTVSVPDYEDWRQPFNAFGRVVRDSEGSVSKIVEYKNANDSERQIREVNPALYCVSASWLATALTRIKPNELTGEYYLTDLVELAVVDGHIIETIPLPPAEALGLNSLEDIENAKQAGELS
jgi:bifunctional UDP-N-acetylglucosamine pyrophosphorylase/glucosamine-1-phosphate N-acetyltransferase